MKHYMIGSAVGYGIGIILILLLLLCGAAQACDNYRIQNVEFARDGNMRIHYECGYVAIRCDSAVTTVPKKTLRQLSNEAARGIDWGSITIVPTIPYPRPGWVVNPERWYIEKVDTTYTLDLGKRGIRREPDSIIGFIWFAGYVYYNCRQHRADTLVDTTWAKKIPLSDKWLTPDQWDRLLRLIERK